MAILPDNVKIDLSSRAVWPEKVEEISPRGFKPVIVFSRFDVASEDRKITAARVRGHNVDKLRQFWTNAEVNSGDWVILQPNGDITVMTDKDFLELLAR